MGVLMKIWRQFIIRITGWPLRRMWEILVGKYRDDAIIENIAKKGMIYSYFRLASVLILSIIYSTIEAPSLLKSFILFGGLLVPGGGSILFVFLMYLLFHFRLAIAVFILVVILSSKAIVGGYLGANIFNKFSFFITRHLFGAYLVLFTSMPLIGGITIFLFLLLLLGPFISLKWIISKVLWHILPFYRRHRLSKLTFFIVKGE